MKKPTESLAAFNKWWSVYGEDPESDNLSRDLAMAAWTAGVTWRARQKKKVKVPKRGPY